jgi:hypothetical protein
MAAQGFTDLPSTQHFAFEFNNQLNDTGARALGSAGEEVALHCERMVQNLVGPCFGD